MNKLALLLCAVLFLLGAVAVAGEAPVGSGAALGSEMLTFDANPTTGYVWTFEVDGDAVTVTDQGLSGPATDAIGAPSTHTFLVEAVKPGEATITFTYARDFAPEEDPQQVVVAAQVDEDKNLTLTTVTDTRALLLDDLGTSTVTATLTANATTGYEWTAVAEGAIAVEDKGYQAEEAEAGIVGVGGVETFVIRPISEGEATVTFTYARSFEKDVPPANTIILSLTVDAENNILRTK